MILRLFRIDGLYGAIVARTRRGSRARMLRRRNATARTLRQARANGPQAERRAAIYKSAVNIIEATAASDDGKITGQF
jgi:hypothetical protein